MQAIRGPVQTELNEALAKMQEQQEKNFKLLLAGMDSKVQKVEFEVGAGRFMRLVAMATKGHGCGCSWLWLDVMMFITCVLMQAAEEFWAARAQFEASLHAKDELAARLKSSLEQEAAKIRTRKAQLEAAAAERTKQLDAREVC